MEYQLQEIPASADNVRQLQRSFTGIQWLKQTGRFSDYVKSRTGLGKEFFSWDGEGWTDENNEHRYMLLQNVSGSYIAAPQLSTDQCLQFLLSTAFENPKVIHVIYGGGYDATQILRDIPLELRSQLKDNNVISWAVPGPVGTGNVYKINYLPHKWLEIRGIDWAHNRHGYIKIYDVMTFFQSSFIAALNSRKIPVPDVITSGKAARADFSYDDLDEIRTYCQMELELLVQLADQLRDEFTEAGIKVTQFHGPGAVASAAYKQFGVRKHMQPPASRELELASAGAYFGGHFEQYQAGHYAGKVYLYDINSAYPYHIQNLPSLAGARWEWTTDFHGQLGIWLCEYDDDERDYRKPHATPWRAKTGHVGYPAINKKVWLHTPEAELATVTGGYELILASDEKPFDFVPEMYRTRKEWQALGKGGERALKLCLNSLYGKQAQRVGGNPERNGGRPSWHQLEWAGMVTSNTRRQIWDAIQLAPDKIIAIETDSVASTVPLALSVGDELGQWGLKEYDWITYVQSGIYFTSDGENGTKSKSRGIDVTKLNHDDVLQFLDSDQSEPLQIDTRTFIGLGNPREKLYGQWQDSTIDVRVAGNKRVHVPSQCDACKRGDSMATTMHNLITNPLYGHTDSQAHKLPWLGETITIDPELGYIGDAVAEYDVPRRNAASVSASGIPTISELFTFPRRRQS